MTKRLYDYDVGENMALFALIKSADVRTAKNGNQFIALNFSDRSGVISAKFWDASPRDVEQFRSGSVVYLKGRRENYQNKPQIKISNLRLAHDGEPADPDLYIQDAPEKTDQMKIELKQYVDRIENRMWHDIVMFLIRKNAERFFSYPAAKSNHHAYAGGLAYHTLSILRLADAVADAYDDVNRSLLYAGAVLHDMGKTMELTGPATTEYTMEGNMLGHIVLIDEQVVLAMNELGIDRDSEDAILLRHMILSHHGLLEYGSPVRPMLLEADILHQLDNLDASIQMIRGAVVHADEGSFTERMYALDGRMFYRPQKN